MKKKKRTGRMAGEHDVYFQLRLPRELRARFRASCHAGSAGKVSKADALRSFIEMRCEFTESKKRQPTSLGELCRWYLEKNKAD